MWRLPESDGLLCFKAGPLQVRGKEDGMQEMPGALLQA